MRRAFVWYSRPIRFDGKSVNRGLPVLDQARAPDPCHRPEGSWALGTRMTTAPRKTGFVWQRMLETIIKQMNKFAAFSYAIRGVGIHYGMAKWLKKSSILFSLLYLLVARRSPPLVIILEIKMMIQTRNSASRIVLRGPSYTSIRSRFQLFSLFWSCNEGL